MFTTNRKPLRSLVFLILPAFVFPACNPEPETEEFTLSDLSGTYKLTYVGPRSDARDSNLVEYCGDTYLLVATGTTSAPYPGYDLFNTLSQNEGRLFALRYNSPIVVSEGNYSDTVLCYQGNSVARYDPEVHTLTDSLLIGIEGIRNRTVFAHPDYFLLQTDRGPRGDYRFFRFERQREN